MSLTVERLPDEPIIIATFHGNTNVEEAHNLFAQSDALIDGDEKVVRITDYRELTPDFATAMKAAQMVKQGEPGSTSDPRITPIIVGTTAWARLSRDMIRQPQWGSVEIAIFTTMDDALTYARGIIAQW